jgi:hypothetical protein
MPSIQEREAHYRATIKLLKKGLIVLGVIVFAVCLYLLEPIYKIRMAMIRSAYSGKAGAMINDSKNIVTAALPAGKDADSQAVSEPGHLSGKLVWLAKFDVHPDFARLPSQLRADSPEFAEVVALVKEEQFAAGEYVEEKPLGNIPNTRRAYRTYWTFDFVDVATSKFLGRKVFKWEPASTIHDGDDTEGQPNLSEVVDWFETHASP